MLQPFLKVAISNTKRQPLFYLLYSHIACFFPLKQAIKTPNVMKRFFLLVVLLGFFCLSPNIYAQKTLVKNINGVEYEVIGGLAEITSIEVVKTANQSDLNYDEHEILFQFHPMEGSELLNILQNRPLSFKLRYRSSQVPIGPAYIKAMRLKKGTKYAMQLFQTRNRSINIERYFYHSKALENNLFKAYEAVIDSLSNTLVFNNDSLSITIDKKTLSDVEQRALSDAELKVDISGEHFAHPAYTQTTLIYLKDCKDLLIEYESALAVLFKLEQQQQTAQDKEKKEQERKAKKIKNKIKALQTTTQPKVVLQTKIIRGCYYEMLPGLAKVTGIKVKTKATDSQWKYDEYEVLFQFEPEEGYELLEELRDTNLSFMLYHRGAKIPVGPAYIEKKNLKLGRRYAMTLYQKQADDACTERYTYESKALDNDLFEALPLPDFYIKLKAKKETAPQDSIATPSSSDSIVITNDSFQIKEELPQKDISNQTDNVLEQYQQTIEEAKANRKNANQLIRATRKKRRLYQQQQNKKPKASKKIQVGDVQISDNPPKK